MRKADFSAESWISNLSSNFYEYSIFNSIWSIKIVKSVKKPQKFQTFSLSFSISDIKKLCKWFIFLKLKKKFRGPTAFSTPSNIEYIQWTEPIPCKEFTKMRLFQTENVRGHTKNYEFKFCASSNRIQKKQIINMFMKRITTYSSWDSFGII